MEVLIPVLGAAAAMAAVGWQGKNEGSRPSRLEPRIGMFFLFYCFFIKRNAYFKFTTTRLRI